MINRWIYDCEVFSHDWFFVFKEKPGDRVLKIHNDNDAVKAFVESEKPLLGGFNNKHYDKFILEAVLCDWDPSQVKNVNDHIIAGGNGWDIPLLKAPGKYFHWEYDLFDDCYVGLSLKAFEAHMGMDIRETTIPFDIDRPLTEQECKEVFFYCEHDVDATSVLDDLRQDYLQTKINLGTEKGLEPERAVGMTNAKLTAFYLDAHPPVKPWTDEKEYDFPANLEVNWIPPQVIDFYGRMDFKEKLEIEIGECPITISWGGIHGAIPNFIWKGERNK